jgi:hypothetical protein
MKLKTKYTKELHAAAKIGISTQPKFVPNVNMRLEAKPTIIEIRHIVILLFIKALTTIGPTNMEMSPPVPIIAI